MITWRLKKNAPRRGHPWVFAQEIATPTKSHRPGAPVELQDDQGRFVARGYGNPKSQISFRALSFDPMDRDPWSRSRVIRRLLDAWETRRAMGFRHSFRLCFGEGDWLPGLVVDLYLGHPGGEAMMVLAVQITTAGMDQLIGHPEVFFKELCEAARTEGLTGISWERTAVVLRNDVRSRVHEGMEEEPPRFVKSVRDADFTRFPIELDPAAGTGPAILMDCDLFQGQKTGFFLDQTMNIRQVCAFLAADETLPTDRPVRVLDLCCYVGHWSTQIARVLKSTGHAVDVTLVDVSAKALDFARGNAEREGATVTVVEADVLKDLGQLEGGYDVVIADPPAFIKAKKDVPNGKHAYLKMNAQAFRLSRPGGLVASCSCSGSLTEEDFRDVIGKALRRNFIDARLIARGGPAPDHPGRLSFPEGLYLKMFVHRLPVQTVGVGAAAAVAPAGEADEP